MMSQRSMFSKEEALSKIVVFRAHNPHGSLVFTNGCFDLFHVGHLHLLEEAKRQGIFLVVGINSDTSVITNKTSGRPIISGAERASIVASIRCVDAVILFDESEPRELIEWLHPDVLVKGSDWSKQEITDRDIGSCNCEVVIIPRANKTSTTGIIAKIKAMNL